MQRAGAGVAMKRATWLCVALLCASFVALGALSLRQKAPTYDEYAYFGLGEYLLKRHRFDVATIAAHPPLAFYLASLPNLHRPLDDEMWELSDLERARPGVSLYHDHDRSRALLGRSQPVGEELDRGRLVLLLLGLALGPWIFLWSRRLYGVSGGLTALALFAFDPNLLAHARLATPDFTFTVMSFGAFYFASSALGSASLRGGHVWVGVFTGAMLLSKHAGLVLLPALLLAYRFGGDSEPAAVRDRVRALGTVAAAALLVFVIGYQLQPQQYLLGIVSQLSHASSGHQSYLLGALSESGWPHYYLVALAVKTPLPLLLLLAWSVAGGALRRAARWDLVCLVLPPVLLLGFFSLVSGPNIGLRYLLPVYPFLIVIASGAASWAWRAPLTRVLLLGLLLWQGVGTLRAHPDYLPFFNELVGGPSGGHLVLADSNLDWGQDLKQLRDYVDEHELGTIRLAYFGSVEPVDFGVEHAPITATILKRALAGEWHGTLAVSANYLVGLYADGDPFEPLRARQADAVIGHSIYVYRFE